MKFYDVDARFTFGKYEGQSLAEVFAKDPKYIDFCNNNIDEFYVSKAVLKELKAGKFTQSKEDLEVDDQFTDEDLDISPEDDEVEEDFDWEEDVELIDDSFEDDFDLGYDDEEDDDF